MNIDSMMYLKNKLRTKANRVKLRYTYYDMKYRILDFGISTPPRLRNQNIRLGWCQKAVDCLADRLSFKEFGNDDFFINDILKANNPDILTDSAIVSALIGSCSFFYVFKDGDNVKIQVIDGANATGKIDDTTNLLTEGYAILERDEKGNIVTEAFFDSESTVYYKNGAFLEEIPNPTGIPLLIPMIYKSDASRPFGHSVISRACMDLVQSASRTLKRTEVSAEFYSFPQKYVTGLSENFESLDAWNSAMSSMMMFTKDDEGDSPKLGQFTQQSMQPHTDELRALASAFGGETGLTLNDLGFATDNPTSAESIKASHEDLRLRTRKAQKCFSVGLRNLGYACACLRDDYPYDRESFADVVIKWRPIFEPDSATLSSIGDGIIKINQAVPEFFNVDNLEDFVGIESTREA